MVNTQKEFDYLIFIGRFQPIHMGHQHIISKALEHTKNLIVLVGSTNKPRTIKNPWTYDERKGMISSIVSLEQKSRVLIAPLEDVMYDDDLWIRGVQDVVADTIDANEIKHGSTRLPSELKIGIIGHNKDESSFYLRLFPQWTQMCGLVDGIPQSRHYLLPDGYIGYNTNGMINSADIRAEMFENNSVTFVRGLVSDAVLTRMRYFVLTPEYAALRKEYAAIQQYKKSWATSPFEPTFVTADVVIVQDGHVLMVVRNGAVGKGLHALPGGFVNTNEYIECAALRELVEETKIGVPVEVLRKSIKQSRIFDHPQRSLRGRTITQAFFIELPSGALPRVEGSDDALSAMWVPLGELDGEIIFEDHLDIIKSFINQ